MIERRHSVRHSLLYMAVIVSGFILVGCTVVGPDVIRSGRMAYNEAITETDNQQILNLVIRDRYEERGHLLSVASVTANVSVTTRAGIQAGFGDSDSYDGNLVPFSGGFIYEENPTISYIPVAGEAYRRQMMSPISIAVLASITAGLSEPKTSYYILVSSVNGIYNPRFLHSGEEDDPRFERFVTLLAELTEAHRLHWADDPLRIGGLSLIIDASSPVYAGKVKELREIVGLPSGLDSSGRAVIPVSLAWNSGDNGGLDITTHSVWDLVEILAGAIDVPEADIEDGVARRAVRPGKLGRELRVHYAQSKPERAYVSVPFRDGWYYIDERDLLTKRYFKVLGSLWSSTIADATAKSSAAPVLTIPVSR
jgi:hypothetical protein